MTLPFRKLLSVSALIAVAGCAPAYHAYPCGEIPLGYCAHPPLPYVRYSVCATPIAGCYQARQGAASSADAWPVPPEEVEQTAPSAATANPEQEIPLPPLLPMNVR